VVADVYRDEIPGPMDMTKFAWEVILRFMGASSEEIRDARYGLGECGMTDRLLTSILVALE
jgi:hypothetical protein